MTFIIQFGTVCGIYQTFLAVHYIVRKSLKQNNSAYQKYKAHTLKRIKGDLKW